MYLLSWLIFNNVFLLMFYVALLVMFILFVVILIIYIYKKTQNKIILIKSAGFLLIFAITKIADHYWCYLATILLIAANFGLINDDVKDALKACFNKSPNVSPLKNETQKQEKQQTEENKAKEYEEEVKNAESASGTTEHQNKSTHESEPNIDDTNCKQFIRPGIIQKYKSTEGNVISWFMFTYNLDFIQNRMITTKNSKPMYPDGICQTKNKDIILEVKLAINQEYILQIIKKAERLFLDYRRIYADSKKDVEFNLAIVLDELNESNLESLQDYTNNDPNFKIYIFIRKINNELQKKMIL